MVDGCKRERGLGSVMVEEVKRVPVEVLGGEALRCGRHHNNKSNNNGNNE